MGGDVSAGVGVAMKHHRCTLLSHGIAETCLVAKKTHLNRKRSGSQVQLPGNTRDKT